MSPAETAACLHEVDASKYIRNDVEETFRDMLDAGSRYRNLEKSLGTGIIFLLGKDISESCWTRLLPKSGGKFDAVVRHMKSINIEAQSAVYSELRKVVIESRLATLVAGSRSSVIGHGSHTESEIPRMSWRDLPSDTIFPTDPSLFDGTVDFDEFTNHPADYLWTPEH